MVRAYYGWGYLTNTRTWRLIKGENTGEQLLNTVSNMDGINLTLYEAIEQRLSYKHGFWQVA